MRYIHHENGDTTQDLHIREIEQPVLRPGQALVKVICFGINRADTMQRQGKYPAPAGESAILGLEVSGEIVAIQGASVSFKVSDRVFGLVAGGGYAEYVAVDLEHIMPIPDGLSFAQAAGIAECFLTAYQGMFVENNLQAQQHILIHAGASGVGLAAIQLARLKQANVAVTASSQSKLEVCQAQGAQLLINYQSMDFYQVVSQQWPGCDLIIDFVAGDYLNRNLKLLKTDGCVFYLAMLAGRFADNLDMLMLLSKRATIKGSTLRNRSDQYKAALISRFSKDCLEQFSLGKLSPIIDTQYSAQQVGLAHQRMEDNSTMGKLVCSW
jgi:putative PIG3 family NAD(P)H quinone oxidoreductase